MSRFAGYSDWMFRQIPVVTFIYVPVTVALALWLGGRPWGIGILALWAAVTFGAYLTIERARNSRTYGD